MDGVNEKPTAKVIWRHVRRNILSVGLPVLAAWAIYADWSRTQRYKKSQALLAEKYASELKDLDN